METTTTTQSIELFITALLGQNYEPVAKLFPHRPAII
jgi:hypothetical protein